MKTTAGSSNETPLHQAAAKGDESAVSTLIKNGADPNARANYSDDPTGTEPSVTPLHLAAINGNTEIIEVLINKEALVYAKDINGNGAIHLAAENGKTETVNALLDYISSLIKVQGWRNYTPLHYAVWNGHIDTVAALLGRNAEVNAMAFYGDEPAGIEPSGTPLHWAARRGRTEIAKMMLNKGADISAKDFAGNTPIHSAAYAGQTEIINVLLEKSPSLINKRNLVVYTPLHAAVQNGHKAAVLSLLEKGSDVNAEAKYRNESTDVSVTPLHLAARGGHTEIANILLSKGANKTAKDENNRTPLDLAELGGKTETAKAIKMFTSRRVRSIKKEADQNVDFSRLTQFGTNYAVSKIKRSTQLLIDNEFEPGLKSLQDDKPPNAHNSLSVDSGSFLSRENITLLHCIADALDNPSSKQYQSSVSQGVKFIPNNRIALDFALKKFDSFVRSQIRHLSLEERARIRHELEEVRPEVRASLERGVEFSGIVGLDDVLRLCKECFCKYIVAGTGLTTCLSTT